MNSWILASVAVELVANSFESEANSKHRCFRVKKPSQRRSSAICQTVGKTRKFH